MRYTRNGDTHLSLIRLDWDKHKVRYTRRELETWSGAHEMAYHMEWDSYRVGNT